MEKNTEKQVITMNTEVIDVGGGLRLIHAADVLDCSTKKRRSCQNG